VIKPLHHTPHFYTLSLAPTEPSLWVFDRAPNAGLGKRCLGVKPTNIPHISCAPVGVLGILVSAEVLEVSHHSPSRSGIQPGAVPPLGNLFNLEVIADPALFENKKIVFNAGDRTFSIAMKSADYQQIVQPQVRSITRG
jgi:Aminoacyl-tRNA editing domain